MPTWLNDSLCPLKAVTSLIIPEIEGAIIASRYQHSVFVNGDTINDTVVSGEVLQKSVKQNYNCIQKGQKCRDRGASQDLIILISNASVSQRGGRIMTILTFRRGIAIFSYYQHWQTRTKTPVPADNNNYQLQ